MIRFATIDDLGELMTMGRRFHEKASLDHPSFDSETFANTLVDLLSGDLGVVIVADDEGAAGMIGGVLYSHWLNNEYWVAQELFWWMETGHNGAGRRLLDAFEAWAYERGASSVVMVALESLRPKAVGRVYRGRGYETQEHVYTRKF